MHLCLISAVLFFILLRSSERSCNQREFCVSSFSLIYLFFTFCPLYRPISSLCLHVVGLPLKKIGIGNTCSLSSWEVREIWHQYILYENCLCFLFFPISWNSANYHLVGYSWFMCNSTTTDTEMTWIILVNALIQYHTHIHWQYCCFLSVIILKLHIVQFKYTQKHSNHIVFTVCLFDRFETF